MVKERWKAGIIKKHCFTVEQEQHVIFRSPTCLTVLATRVIQNLWDTVHHRRPNGTLLNAPNFHTHIYAETSPHYISFNMFSLFSNHFEKSHHILVQHINLLDLFISYMYYSCCHPQLSYIVEIALFQILFWRSTILCWK